MTVYATSDWHGFVSLYDEVKKILKPEDKVYFLGDATDRGPQGWSLLKLLLDDSQFIYLRGNHDVMFLDSYRAGTEAERIESARLHSYNGGDWTIDGFIEDSVEIQQKYLDKLEKTPYYQLYKGTRGVVYMSHSGAHHSQVKNLFDLVWDRRHFFYDIDVPDVDYIVHGHTPIPYLISSLNDYKFFADIQEEDEEFVPGRPFWYAHRAKCDIDQGTIQSGFATLLDLDTFESIPVKVAGWEKDFLWR